MIKTAIAGDIAFRLELTQINLLFCCLVQMRVTVLRPEEYGTADRPDFSRNQLLDMCSIDYGILENVQLIKTSTNERVSLKTQPLPERFQLRVFFSFYCHVRSPFAESQIVLFYHNRLKKRLV